jgi:catechol 2,3-dioxygenase-like lactoylglutathione lyase family enzyme
VLPTCRPTVGESSRRSAIPITFNHLIIVSRDREASARFYREILEAHEAPSWGPFTNILLDEGVLLQFAEPPVEPQFQHLAFLVDDELFDRILDRLRQRDIAFWADPQSRLPGEINHEHGGRGVYFRDPSGHGLEIITRPYL